MSDEGREIYSSPNGDCWTLLQPNGSLVVRHQANIPSGGMITDVELPDFLKNGGLGPEKQSLLQLIGALVEPEDATGIASTVGQTMPGAGYAG